MKAYKVTQRYYGSGDVDYDVEEVYVKPEEATTKYVDRKDYVLYIDYFFSKKDLGEFISQF